MGSKSQSAEEMRTCQYCGNEYKGSRGLKQHQSRKHKDEIQTDVRCTWCGDDVTVREWEADERHYCSRACSKAWRRFLKSGKRHPNYKDGGSPDMTNRVQLMKMAVRRRDGYQCKRCGSEDTGDGRRLHVHHITPEDSAANPHRFENLIAVCDGCHKPLEAMDPAEQLAACGLESREELTLPDEIREWYENKMADMHHLGDAYPEPWVGMYAEAQRVIDRREKAD